MSRRTDGGPASKQAQRYISGMPNYGDGQELADLQASAPMAATPSAKPVSATAVNQAASAPAQGAPAQTLTPLNAPTQRPNEPVTTGLTNGPGAGPSILGMPQGVAAQQGQSAKQLVQTLASRPDASPVLQKLAATLGR
jgi:hypothetical protein